MAIIYIKDSDEAKLEKSFIKYGVYLLVSIDKLSFEIGYYESKKNESPSPIYL